MISLTYNIRLISKDNQSRSRNSKGQCFLLTKYRGFESAIKTLTKQQYKGELLTGNIGMQITALYTNKKHQDCVNLSKSICDALQNIVYKNDKQIKEIFIKVFEGKEKDCFQVDIQGIEPLPDKEKPVKSPCTDDKKEENR